MIEKDRVLEELALSLEWCSEDDNPRGSVAVKIFAVRNALELLKQQPTIVRCKDCKWYKEGYDIDGKWFSRCNGSVRTYGHTKPDWFCADGKVN